MKEITHITIKSLILIVPSTIFGIYIGTMHNLPFAKTISDFSDFGTFIGGITALIAVYLGYKVNTNQNNQFEKQSQQFERQNFESGYFGLLNIFFEEIKLIKSSYPYIRFANNDTHQFSGFEGRRIHILFSRAIREINEGQWVVIRAKTEVSISTIDELVENNSSELGYFVELARNINNFILDSDYGKNQYRKYFSLFRNQLTPAEKEIIDYIILTPPSTIP